MLSLRTPAIPVARSQLLLTSSISLRQRLRRLSHLLRVRTHRRRLCLSMTPPRARRSTTPRTVRRLLSAPPFTRVRSPLPVDSATVVASVTYTINLPASAVQNVVMSQAIAMGALPSSGGAQSGGEPAGDTMAVNTAGNLIASNTYGNGIVMFTPGSTTPTVLGSISNPNGVAVDSQNNIYIGLSYSSQVVKIPYVNGTYAAIAGTSGTTPNCTGHDTVECVMSNVTISGGSGVVSLVFDSKGDLFFGTTNQNQGGSNISSIYECTAACLYTGTPAA